MDTFSSSEGHYRRCLSWLWWAAGGLATMVTRQNDDLTVAKEDEHIERLGLGRVAGGVLLALFFVILLGSMIAKKLVPYEQAPPLWWFETFYYTGSLIFGGGQVGAQPPPPFFLLKARAFVLTKPCVPDQPCGIMWVLRFCLLYQHHFFPSQVFGNVSVILPLHPGSSMPCNHDVLYKMPPFSVMCKSGSHLRYQKCTEGYSSHSCYHKCGSHFC
jgi:hypothetical protein